MKPMTARDSRVLALGLLAGFAILILGLVVVPVVDGFLSRRAERADLEAEVEASARLLAGAAAWRARAEAQAADAPRFALDAEDAVTATSLFQAQVAEMLQEEGGELTALEQPSAAPDTIRLTIEAEMTLSQLYACLSRLEREASYALVETLAVRALDAGAEPRLAVRLGLSAVVRIQPGGNGGGPSGNGHG
ncbi:MAG: type II secretion system protein GspM [Zavarzinia sp.]|nr:type II secretion system protein GspM [Zavarzinia sp.]